MSTDTPGDDTQAPNYNFDLTALDGQCRDILQVIDNAGGEASSRQLKADAGVDKNKLHYRLDKILAEIGLIETFTARPEVGGKKLKHASLTEQGRRAIEKGLLDDITDANSSLRQLRREVNEVKERVGSKADETDVSWQLEKIQGKVSRLRKELREADTAEDIKRLDTRLGTFEDDLDELSGRVETIAAQTDDIDALNNRIATLTTRLNEFGEEIEERDRTPNLIAIARQVADLAARLEELPQTEDLKEIRTDQTHLRRRVEKQDRTDEVRGLEQDLADLKGEVADLTAQQSDHADLERVEKLADRVDELENVAGDVAEQTENNKNWLAHRAEEAEYIGLPNDEKREYWVEKAEERIEEIGCSHERGSHVGADEDWVILAHLEEGELRLLEQDGVFSQSAIHCALHSDIPGPCRHGSVRYALFYWYYDRQR